MNQLVYIDIESLMDVRLATLNKVNSDAVQDMLLNDKYHSFNSNLFSLLDDRFDQSKVDEAWDQRNAEDLKVSVCTGVTGYLVDIGLRAKERIEVPIEITPRLSVDMLHYDLPAEDRIELVTVLQEQLNYPVEIISPLLTDRGLESFYRKFDTIIVSDFDKWVTNHIDEIVAKPFNNKDVYAPLVYTKPPAKELTHAGMVSATKASLIGLISPTLVPLASFRIVRSKAPRQD